jgi:hypothetical protein
VWGYIGSKTVNTNYPYSSTDNTEIANDTDNWIQLGKHAISNGVATFTETVFQIQADTALTTYTAQFDLDICFPKIRFSAYTDTLFYTPGSFSLVALIQ